MTLQIEHIPAAAEDYFEKSRKAAGRKPRRKEAREPQHTSESWERFVAERFARTFHVKPEHLQLFRLTDSVSPLM